jgi:hypothetical protein
MDEIPIEEEQETTVFGLNVDATPEDLGVPMEAVVILKHYHEGELGYHIFTTDSLLTVECLGMVEWAKLLISDGVVLVTDHDGDEEEDDDE